jgi:hypothetical protein
MTFTPLRLEKLGHGTDEPAPTGEHARRHFGVPSGCRVEYTFRTVGESDKPRLRDHARGLPGAEPEPVRGRRFLVEHVGDAVAKAFQRRPRPRLPRAGRNSITRWSGESGTAATASRKAEGALVSTRRRCDMIMRDHSEPR